MQFAGGLHDTAELRTLADRVEIGVAVHDVQSEADIGDRLGDLAGPGAALAGVMMGEDQLYAVAEAVCGALRLAGELARGAESGRTSDL